MSEEKIKILEADYNVDKELAKVKIKRIGSNKEDTWALTADSFDSLIGQITGTSLEYSPVQRALLCETIVGMELTNQIQIDIENADIESAKDKSMNDLKYGHDVVDMYPFYEIQQEAIEEATKPPQE